MLPLGPGAANQPHLAASFIGFSVSRRRGWWQPVGGSAGPDGHVVEVLDRLLGDVLAAQ
jgi:hypothetical protein